MKNRFYIYALIILATLFVVKNFMIKERHDNKVVNIYSSRKEILTKQLFAEFTKKTGIKVNYINDEANKLIARIKNEGKNSPADVFMTADVLNLLTAQENHLFIPVNSSILIKKIPIQFRDKDDQWFGLTIRARVIAYAKDRVHPVKDDLRDYEDLANARWKGRLLMRSSNSSYNQSLLSSVILADGKEYAHKWVRGMVSNFARQPSGGDTDQLKAVAAGEGDLTVVNTYYLARLLASKIPIEREIGHKIGILFPNQGNRGTMINISGAGVMKNAPHKAAAKALLEFMVQDRAQKIYAQNNQEYPVVQTVAISPVLQKWGGGILTGHNKISTTPLYKLAQYMKEAVKIADKEGWR